MTSTFLVHSWSQSFLLKNLAIVLSIFLMSRWLDSIFSSVMLAPMCCRTLQTVFSSWSSAIDEGNPTRSTHSRQEYRAFFQHCLSTDTICLHNMLFTFLTTTISDSSFLKLSLIFFISSVREFIIPLVCSCSFKNSSIRWVLFIALSVSSVYIPVISSTNITMTENG